MTPKMEQSAIISGIGLSEIGRRLPRPTGNLALDAIRAAVTDAGLTTDEIDGLITSGDLGIDAVQDSLGLRLSWSAKTRGLASLVAACMAVASGFCRHVVVYREVNMVTGEMPGAVDDFEWHVPFRDYSAAGVFAVHLRRHMHLYGTTREQLGALAVTSRSHALLNPEAIMSEPLTMDEYLSAKWIVEPIGLFDCDVPIDGAVAFVVSDVAHGAHCPHHPVRFEAVGTAVWDRPSWDNRTDHPAMAAKDAAAHLWSRTDLRPSDVDLAELYDGFTFLTLSWLEALGFCGEGESGPFVEGGDRIRLGGALPLNTYGGQLSAGRLHMHWVAHEAVVQLRHAAGERQVLDAEVAAVAAGGGPSGNCLLLTR